MLDGAGWHQTGGRLKVPPNLTLLPLPPYAPELIPVEDIWKYLRANGLSHTVWESHDAVLDDCCSAWTNLLASSNQIFSIAPRDWASVNVWRR